MAGGDAAIREPWRAALSYLMDAFGPDAEFAAAPAERVRVVRHMLRKRVNTWQTSSCGRLFDAVASLGGIRHEVNFEGQAAIELEAIAADSGEAYPFAIDEGAVDFRPAIRSIVEITGAGGGDCGAISPDGGIGDCGTSGRHRAGVGTRPGLPERRDISELEAARPVDSRARRRGLGGVRARPGTAQRRRHRPRTGGDGGGVVSQGVRLLVAIRNAPVLESGTLRIWFRCHAGTLSPA